MIEFNFIKGGARLNKKNIIYSYKENNSLSNKKKLSGRKLMLDKIWFF